LYIADGDSVTAGQGLTSAQRYADVAIASRTGTYDYYNVAVGGATCLERDIAASAAGGADKILGAHQTIGATISIECGLNDLYQGATPATAMSRILTYVANRKAAGWRNVIVFTNTDASTVNETDRATLNASIVSNAGANGYTVADVGSDPSLGCSGCDTNATYFQSDHVHPTATGQSLIATGYLEPIFTTLGIN
jgi:lysophospholipase L1-like esterase